jgi:hypothetical protein
VLADAGKINIMVAGWTSWVLLTFSAVLDEIIPDMIACMRS